MGNHHRRFHRFSDTEIFDLSELVGNDPQLVAEFGSQVRTLQIATAPGGNSSYRFVAIDGPLYALAQRLEVLDSQN